MVGMTNLLRKHLSNDLQPYTCYLSECIQDNPMFSEFQAWKHHVVNDHRSFRGWSCPLCQPLTDFREETDLHDHIQRAHPQVAAEDYSKDLPSISKVYSAPEFNVCPVCSIREVEWKTTKQEVEEIDPATERASTNITNSIGGTFLDHIGLCMHAFALRALPATVNDLSNTEFASPEPYGCRTEESTPSISSQLLDLPTASGNEGRNSLTLVNLQSALPSPMVANTEDGRSNSAIDHLPLSKSTSDPPKDRTSLVQSIKSKMFKSAKSSVSELDEFFAHVNACTASAVVESGNLHTRPIVSIRALGPYFTTGRLRGLLLCVGGSIAYETLVRERYLVVFSILLSIGKGPFINKFIQHGELVDERLPFLTRDVWPEASSEIFDEFYEAQWQFCAKTLVAEGLNDTKLCDNMVMPFKKIELLRDGSDSTISKVELFEEYNSLIPVRQPRTSA